MVGSFVIAHDMAVSNCLTGQQVGSFYGALGAQIVPPPLSLIVFPAKPFLAWRVNQSDTAIVASPDHIGSGIAEATRDLLQR